MKNSTGIVMQLDKRHAFIMTNSGQFLKVKIGKKTPSVGEIYTGAIATATPFYRYAAAAASLMFVLLSGTASYAYYTPTASVVVNINPSIELKINRWDRILKTIPLNSDGEKVLASLNVKNKSLTEGLDLIVDEAKIDNFINDDYIKSGKIITVSVETTNSSKKPDVSKFEEYAKKNNLKVSVVNDEKKKDIPAKEEKNNSNDSDKLNKDNQNQDKAGEKSNNGGKEVNNPGNSNNKDNSPKNKSTENNNGNTSYNSSSKIAEVIKRYVTPRKNEDKKSANTDKYNQNTNSKEINKDKEKAPQN